MLALLILVNLAAFRWIENFYINIGINFLFGIFIIWIINLDANLTASGMKKTSKLRKNVILFLRNMYYFLAIFLIYSQFQVLIKVFHPIDYDIMLNNWDIAILGKRIGDITFSITTPLLTEYLQIAYSTFYFLPLLVGIEIYGKHDIGFDLFLRNILFTYFLSYFLYFIFPAIGPRFTVYDFTTLNSDLPGLFLTDFLRAGINFGGGIVNNAVNPAMIVNRDCMPSGHTMITLVNIFWAYKLRVKSRHFILILGLSIMFATVYMRYHYLVDVLAGIFFAAAALLLEPIFNRFFKKVFVKFI
jgi:membrane-associated phospholipid phosphatase